MKRALAALVPVAAAVLAAATCVHAQDRQAFTTDDVYRIVALSAPQLSPDGARVLVTVRTADREHDRRNRRLDLIDVATGARTTLPLPEHFGSQHWSPSGDRIAYLSEGGVWIADANGAEARRVTAASYDVLQFAWRPDGAALAFVALDAAPPKSGDESFLDGYRVGNDAALASGATRFAHVFLQPLDGGPVRALGPRTGSAASGDAESTLSFTPDGRTLAYLQAPTNLGNDAVQARIRLVDLATGAERVLDGAGQVHDPLYSPDGTALAYVHSDGDDQLNPNELFVSAPDGATPRALSHPVDRAVRDIAWQPGSQNLYFTARSGTRIVLFRSLRGARPKPIDLGGLNVSSGLDGALAANGTLAFVGENTDHPPELYLRAAGAPPKALTAYNEPLRTLALASSERITYPTSVGVRGDAILTKPAGFAAGRRYPLVLVIHGGPTSASTQSFEALSQLLAARGWLVLEPNYRGSDNLGARYQRAVGGDKLRGPGRDIDAAIAAVRARGILDGRLAVSGWSYGAGLTLWMIEQRHDWRAAVAGAAVTDIAADYATADDIAADRALVGGSPFVAPYRAAAAAMSPISYVAQVRTPLLLMTCRGDTRVSPVGTYEFFHALRDLGRPVELIAYPVDGHFPSDPVRANDVLRRWVSFIAARFGS